MSKPKGRRGQVRKDKETARKVSELLNRTRSPDPGRQCPCGYPRQVVRMSRLPRGAVRYPPDGSPSLCQLARASVHVLLTAVARPGKPVHAGDPWFQVRHGLPVNHK